MKMVGLVFLGIVCTIVVGVIVNLFLMMFLPLSSAVMLFLALVFPLSGENIFVAILLSIITMPIALFFGSPATGYYVYNKIESRKAFFWLAPGLYCGLFFIFATFVNGLWEMFRGAHNMDFLTIGIALLAELLITLWWYLVSLAGVELGYNIREYLE